MRNRRRNWLLRRLALGLAVAAIAAPTAQARLYEGGAAESGDGNGVLIQGDDKVIVDDGSLGKGPVRTDDKVFAPVSVGVPAHDDKVIVEAPASDGVPVGDDKVILSPRDWQYTQAGYWQGTPFAYYGDSTQVRNTEPIPATHGKPVGRQVPIAATGTGSEFNWADGLIGAAAALGLAALAYGAARSTREMRRPATH